MVCLELATPVAKTCDAAGVALRPWRREWLGTDYWPNLVSSAYLANAAVCNICITVLVRNPVGHTYAVVRRTACTFRPTVA